MSRRKGPKFYITPVAGARPIRSERGRIVCGNERRRGQRLQTRRVGHPDWEYTSARPRRGDRIDAGARVACVRTTSRGVLRNDAGTQVAVFARTLYARYPHCSRSADPETAIRAHKLSASRRPQDDVDDRYLREPGQEPDAALGDEGIRRMVAQIREDLALLGVKYDRWFNERSLYDERGPYERAMQILREHGHVVQREGATWFASSQLGESKDNVLIRSDGAPTYFASDVAYHYDKFVTRGFTRVIDIWGADHQGHVSRVKARHAVGGNGDTGVLRTNVTLSGATKVLPLSKRGRDVTW